jgi:hypothetical protein
VTARTILLALVMLGVPAATFMAGGLIMERWSRRAEVAPPGQAPLYQRFRYNAEDVRTYWKAFGGKLSRERLFLELDLVFPFLYGGGLAAGLLLAWASLGRPFHPAWVLAPVLVGVLADWTENLIQLGQMRIYVNNGPQALQDGWIRVASVATAVKLASLGGALVVLFFLVGWVLVRMLRAG